MIPTKDQQRMNTSKQTYILTGAAGFIGSNICQALLSQPETQFVIGVDNLNDYYSPKIKTHRLFQFKNNRKFIFFEKSILDYVSMQKITEIHKPTTLIHTASDVGVNSGELHPLQYFSTNVLGSLTVLEACKKYIKHAIMFSSSSVYGNCKHVPFSETEEITIETPISTYGASKASMEIGVKNYFIRTGIPTTIIRPFSVYGPNGRPDMLPIKLLISAYTHSPFTVYSPQTLKRDWTYIDDFVYMFMSAVNSANRYQIINIGSGMPIALYDVIEIAKTVLHTYGLELRYGIEDAKPYEMQQTWANNKRITSRMSNHVYTGFEVGFAKTAQFFFAHRDLYTV